MTAPELQAWLLERIPLAAEMGVVVSSAGPERVELRAPLDRNLNHSGTAFGGSVSALAVLAGWGLVHLRLGAGRLDATVVIQRSEVDFTAPGTGDLRAVCAAPPASSWDRFVRTLDRKGRGRIHVDAVVRSGETEVATFRGAYVALPPPVSPASSSRPGAPG